MLELKVLAHEDNRLEARWAFDEVLCRDNATPPRWSSASTTNAFSFRAVLTEEAHEVELALVYATSP